MVTVPLAVTSTGSLTHVDSLRPKSGPALGVRALSARKTSVRTTPARFDLRNSLETSDIAEKPESASAPLRSRRELMTQLALSSTVTAAVLCGFPQPSQAGFDLDSLIGTTSNGLPKGYVKLAEDLIETLSSSLELEASGAKELKVRAKADKAKEKIQVFLRDWKGRPEVSSDASYVAISDALRVLGEFYAKNGQLGPKSRLPDEVIANVRNKLAVAELALNPEI